MIFQERRKTGRLDLEGTEMALRSAMHHAGATAFSELLNFPIPAAEQRSIPCACGHRAGYQELRSKPVLTAVGEVTVSRPYYLCAHCHRGQFPADVELDIEETEFSPGVRRMLATVGQEAAFDRGRQRMKLFADLEVTTKAVERTSEAIGEDIAARDRIEIQRAVQLDLPVIVGEPIPVLYVQVDGTGVPVVKKETVGRQGKTEGQPAHTREAKLGCVFTQTTWDEEGYAIRDPNSTTYVGAIETAEEFGKRIYLEAWKRGWSRAVKKIFMGDGSEWIWNIADLHFPGATQIVDLSHARQHLWDLARKLYPNQEAEQRRWMMIHQDLLDGARLKSWYRHSALWIPPIRNWLTRFASKPAISKTTWNVCATPSSASNTYLSARASSKPGAKPSSARAVSSRGCSGRCVAPMPSWLCAAASSTAGLKITGKRGELN